MYKFSWLCRMFQQCGYHGVPGGNSRRLCLHCNYVLWNEQSIPDEGWQYGLVEVNHPYMNFAVVLLLAFCGHSLVYGSDFTTLCCFVPEKHCPLQFDFATLLQKCLLTYHSRSRKMYLSLSVFAEPAVAEIVWPKQSVIALRSFDSFYSGATEV